ncbi:MAG: hypothetical protein KJO55_06790 [Gammaproteobacteria bacterium]|nr:hypothetical protein [Gammaproteobacteria bacterium]
MTSTTATQPAPRWLRATRALGDRRMAAMLLLSFAAGLPYGAVLGTLNAWFTQGGVSPAAIGAFSIILLAYAFKFLWAPAFQRPLFPFPQKLGPRRAWLGSFQVLIAILLMALALSNPVANIGWAALIALLVAVFSASHDIVLDAWRIEVARNDEDLDLMSAIYQFGYRAANLITGLVALVLASRIGWSTTYLLIAFMMVVSISGTLVAPEPALSKTDTPRETFADRVDPRARTIVTWLVAAAWAAAAFMLVSFVIKALSPGTEVSGRNFVREQGPFIILLCVIGPAVASAWLLGRYQADAQPVPMRGIGSVLFRVILDPLMELISRLRWAALLVLALVLTYRFTDLVWGAFAYPFYLGTEHGAIAHTLDEVAIASKTFGTVMTVVGAGVGGVALIFIGRMPCLLFGAFIAAVTNLLFADLAGGAVFLDAALAWTQLDHAFAALGADQRMARLMLAIAGENLAIGFASVASVAYLTSIVNPRFAAVQYALLVSLTMLIGTLGRPALGEMIETDGFRAVFILTAWLGMVAVILAALEWVRQSRSRPLVTSDNDAQS